MTTETPTKFDPIVMVYHPWSAAAMTCAMKSNCMPDATILSEMGLTSALNTLKNQNGLPEAYFIDAPIFPHDWEAVNFAIRLLEKHKDLAENGSHAPYVFLYNDLRSGEAARKITEETGLTVHRFESEDSYDTIPQEPISDFSRFIEQTKEYKPQPRKKPLYQIPETQTL